MKTMMVTYEISTVRSEWTIYTRLTRQYRRSIREIGYPLKKSLSTSVVPSQQTGAEGAPWFAKIRLWSPVVLASGAAGPLSVFVVVVPVKTLVP